jgi:hypothetical protein
MNSLAISKKANKNYCLMFMFSEPVIGHLLQMLSDVGHDSKTEKQLDCMTKDLS